MTTATKNVILPYGLYFYLPSNSNSLHCCALISTDHTITEHGFACKCSLCCSRWWPGTGHSAHLSPALPCLQHHLLLSHQGPLHWPIWSTTPFHNFNTGLQQFICSWTNHPLLMNQSNWLKFPDGRVQIRRSSSTPTPQQFPKSHLSDAMWNRNCSSLHSNVIYLLSWKDSITLNYLTALQNADFFFLFKYSSLIWTL